MILKELKWSFLPKHTYFRVCAGATAKIGNNVTIRNSRIVITSGSIIEIGDNVCIENSEIFIVGGKCVIGDYSIVGSMNERLLLNIEEGEIHFGHHSKISAKRFWVRFGGIVCVGSYTNINGGSEVRCDESVSIGSYNQISYNVNIWDTNTHNILPVQERRAVAEKYYPYFGKETSRPATAPIIIGDDCWLGQNASILKGSNLGDGVIVGYNSTIIGKTIPANATVVTDVTLRVQGR